MLLGGLFALFATACSKKEEGPVALDPETEARIAAFRAEVQNYYETKVALPPAVFEDLESGKVTQEEIDARTAAGEFPKLFTFATLDDLPDDLVWANGSELPEIGSPKATKGGTAYGAIQDFPRTLRTVGPDANGSFRRYLLDDVVMLLAHPHPDTNEIGPEGEKYFPGLAKEWAIDKENSTVYVRLEPEARFSDGEPITADDYLFCFFFFQSSYLKAPWYKNFYNRFYENVTKYDDYTISVKVSVNKPDLTKYVFESVRPIPEHFYGELGDDFPERYQWRFAPTTSPYILKEEDIKKGDSLTFTRLEDWWAKDRRNFRYRFNYDRIHIRVVRDIAKSFEMFKKGELDAASLTLSEYWYEKLPDDDPLVEGGYIKKATFYNQRPRPPYGLWINTSKPLLDDLNIRLGIQYATNWDLVIEKYFRGDYERLDHTAVGYGVFSNPEVKARPYSIEKAAEHFAKAGYAERGPDGILVNDKGQRLSFSVSTGYQSFKDALTIIKEEAEKAGIEFRLRIMDGTAGFKLAVEKQHDIHFMAWGYSPEMYPRYWETFHSVNAYNPDGSVKVQTNNLNVFRNSDMDRMIEQYRASNDVDEMIALAHRMEQLLHDEAIFVPGFVIPFYRIGYWRWREYPENFDVMKSESSGQWAMGWINVEARMETLKARDRGQTFEKSIKYYDQHKSK